MTATARRRTLTSAAEVPLGVLETLLAEMTRRLDRSPAACAAAGVSVVLHLSDHRLATVRWDVGPGGTLRMRRDAGTAPATFSFTGSAATVDQVLRGHHGVVTAVLTGRLRMHGSLGRLRSLLRLFPALQETYVAVREELTQRYAHRYVFAF